MKWIGQIAVSSLMVMIFTFAALSQPAREISAALSPGFEKAAKKNAVLVRTLRWNWGRRQTGWYLYVPLLNKTLKTQSESGSPEFAAAVAKWQKTRKIRATGIIDQKTLFLLIGFWQSQRIKPIYEARQYLLLDAPISDFYDPTREASLLKVDKEAHRAYRKMFAAARSELAERTFFDEADSLFLKIISSYRSPAYQAELRNRQPGANRAQLAYRSPHFTGRALDIYVGGEPVSTHDPNRAIQVKTPAYRWLVRNADRFGFYPYFYEPWHWEYVGR